MSDKDSTQTNCQQQLPGPTDIKKFSDYLLKLKGDVFIEGSNDGERWLYPVFLSADPENETRYKYYRLVDDRHWILRQKWIDSDFKLPIEVYDPDGWQRATPDWSHDKGYRVSPKVKSQWSNPDESELQPIELNLENLETEVDQFEVPHDETLSIDWGNKEGDRTVIVKRIYVANNSEYEDTGTHYRFAHKAPVTVEDSERGYVEVKLDPFRIADVYGMTDFALQTILKKTLCAGNRGHNDLREDLKDIICAAKRKLEMLDEDEQLAKTKKEES